MNGEKLRGKFCTFEVVSVRGKILRFVIGGVGRG